MLSKKMAFSLMSLITLLALAFVAPSAMAAAFEIKVTGPTTANYVVKNDGKIDYSGDVEVKLKVTSGQPIDDLDTTTKTGEITLAAFDKDGFVAKVAAISVSDLPKGTKADEYAMRTPKEHQLLVTIKPGGTQGNEYRDAIAKVVISIKGGITSTDPTLAAADATSKVDVVRHTITLSAAADRAHLPKVVSIQRLRPGSQTVVAAFQEEKVTAYSFDVRFVLSEAHSEYDGSKNAYENANLLIEVENGVPRDLVVGVPFARRADEDGTQGSTILPHPSEGMYAHSGVPKDGLAGVASGADSVNVPLPTSTDEMYRQYRVTIYPHRRKGDSSKTFEVKIKVKNFHDGGSPIRNTYLSPGFGESANLPNGRELLTVDVAYTEVNVDAGYRVVIDKDLRIPAGGYLVIVQNYEGSEVEVPGGSKKDPPKRSERTPVQMKYNVHEESDLPNLATAFPNGVVVDVESYNHQLLITEVMWGEDTSLNTASHSQYIELHNTDPDNDYVTIDDKLETPWLNEAVTLVFYAPNEFDNIPLGEEFQQGFLVDASGQVLTEVPDWWGETWVERPEKLPWHVSDRIGTLDVEGTYWSVLGIGRSGRSGTQIGELTTGRGPFEPSVPIVSMYRVMDDAGTVEDGQMKASWASSDGPKSANFKPLAIGIRHGTPGAATEDIVTPADTAKETKTAEDAKKTAADEITNTGTYPTLGQGRVYISEVMFAGGGTLPQWIEISNGDRSEKFNLSGWTLTVDNAAADTDVDVGATVTFKIPNGTKIAPSALNDPSGDNTPSTILVVTEAGRNSFTRAKESAQIINLEEDNEVELILAGVVRGKYTLLSDMAFLITLAPPEPPATTAPAAETAAAKTTRLAAEKKNANARKAATDIVGNLGADGAAAWALPMDEGARSSIIRRHVQVARGPAAPEEGTEADNWGLASDTFFAQEMHTYVGNSYYGAANDKGTPGFRAGGALPVELSHFRPARDKVTGTVAITWSTQSELNNAGFFIKRSQQADGEFQIINATMIAGAGTTSEKQSYTYTDTTAQPNVVYYYQIEDVSLDGNRQTLTRGIRLKGHIGAAGKLTTLWGDLKMSNE